jgi:hypothetical protein
MTKTGTCGKCGKPCTYVVHPSRALWIHNDTGHYIGTTPERHDCNTYIVPAKEN